MLRCAPIAVFVLVQLGAAVPAGVAAPPRAMLQLATLDLPGARTDLRPALSQWGQEVRLRTSIRVTQRAVTLKPEAPALLRHPLLVLAGDRALAKATPAAITRLREHLTTGGLLIIDDVGRSGPSPAFDASVRRLVRRLFGRPLQKVPAGDVVYRSFYRLDRPVGRRASRRSLDGLRIGQRWAVLYSGNDLHGAFSRSPTGGPALPVLPGGERQREMAWRLGVNLVVYAMCLDYKDDHTHVGHLLRRRRGR